MARWGRRRAARRGFRHARAEPPGAARDHPIPGAGPPGTRPGTGSRLPAGHSLLLSGEAVSVDAGPGQSARYAGSPAGVLPASSVPGPADSWIAVRACATALPAATGVPAGTTQILKAGPGDHGTRGPRDQGTRGPSLHHPLTRGVI